MATPASQQDQGLQLVLERITDALRGFELVCSEHVEPFVAAAESLAHWPGTDAAGDNGSLMAVVTAATQQAIPLLQHMTGASAQEGAKAVLRQESPAARKSRTLPPTCARASDVLAAVLMASARLQELRERGHFNAPLGPSRAHGTPQPSSRRTHSTGSTRSSGRSAPITRDTAEPSRASEATAKLKTKAKPKAKPKAKVKGARQNAKAAAKTAATTSGQVPPVPRQPRGVAGGMEAMTIYVGTLRQCTWDPLSARLWLKKTRLTPPEIDDMVATIARGTTLMQGWCYASGRDGTSATWVWPRANGVLGGVGADYFHRQQQQRQQREEALRRAGVAGGATTLGTLERNMGRAQAKFESAVVTRTQGLFESGVKQVRTQLQSVLRAAKDWQKADSESASWVSKLGKGGLVWALESLMWALNRGIDLIIWVTRHPYMVAGFAFAARLVLSGIRGELDTEEKRKEVLDGLNPIVARRKTMSELLQLVHTWLDHGLEYVLPIINFMMRGVAANLGSPAVASFIVPFVTNLVKYALKEALTLILFRHGTSIASLKQVWDTLVEALNTIRDVYDKGDRFAREAQEEAAKPTQEELDRVQGAGGP